jgi:hypothetical protein
VERRRTAAGRRPAPGGGIEILRVLHGARHIAGILAEEFGVEDDADDEAANGD